MRREAHRLCRVQVEGVHPVSIAVPERSRGYGRLRCIEPQDFCGKCDEYRANRERHENSGCAGSFTGCGWDGPSEWIRTFGMIVWRMEECPDCQGEVEAEA